MMLSVTPSDCSKVYHDTGLDDFIEPTANFQVERSRSEASKSDVADDLSMTRAMMREMEDRSGRRVAAGDPKPGL